MDRPSDIRGKEYRFDAFTNGRVLNEKKKQHLPAMGWNSWNAFGSGNTEALTKLMADKLVELGLDKLGYKYVVLDDGCYKPERVDGLLSNEEVKFPSGFKALSDYIHNKGLCFGMYNDIGTNLCAGAAVGTCGHEDDDARSYVGWGVDFIKVDNCYYLWDNATFSNPENARYTFAPALKAVGLEPVAFCPSSKEEETCISLKEAITSGQAELVGKGALLNGDYITSIGTFDGTGPDHSPVGEVSGELALHFKAAKAGDYYLRVLYATGKDANTQLKDQREGAEPEAMLGAGMGEWLQVAIGSGGDSCLCMDELLPPTSDPETFVWSERIKVRLAEGDNLIRFMNHRRQENTLASYARLQEGFNKACPGHDIILSICEWGKTQPQSWGYKTGDSWRILNDITFQVGSDGNPGNGAWASDYTTSVAAQYNKAVIMDEFAGLDKGWNDPDMLMIGMNGLDETMCRTHMTMWCMMNSPLMLGLDLRRVEKGDWIYKIIANKDIIALNQDALGIQAKRVYTSAACGRPDKDYIRDNNRLDVLAKPLADGSIAVSFINMSETTWEAEVEIELTGLAGLADAKEHKVTDLWTGEVTRVTDGKLKVAGLPAHDNRTYHISL